MKNLKYLVFFLGLWLLGCEEKITPVSTASVDVQVLSQQLTMHMRISG